MAKKSLAAKVGPFHEECRNRSKQLFMALAKAGDMEEIGLLVSYVHSTESGGEAAWKQLGAYLDGHENKNVLDNIKDEETRKEIEAILKKKGLI